MRWWWGPLCTRTTRRRILDHVSDTYVACVGLFGHLFWNKRSFWQLSIVKLFPVIYANYQPMTDDRRQTETLIVFALNKRPTHATYASDTWSSILQFVHNLFWLKLKWNARSKLFYFIIYHSSMLWWSSRTLWGMSQRLKRKLP
jgi:hypothetical protein